MATRTKLKLIRIATTKTLILSFVLIGFLGFGQPKQANAWWLFSNEATTTTAAPAQAAATGTHMPASAKPTAAAAVQGQQQQLRQQQEMRATARFDLDGVRGQFKFTQSGPREPTRVEYDLTGLRGNNKLYHVHVRPVPEHQHQHQHGPQAARNTTQLCGDPATGGHLNPFKITQKLPPKSAPLDKYEIGDLSGKHGPLMELQGQSDHYVGTYVDSHLPMSGEHSIVGRSIVIHKNDGARWVCASILPK